jgi:hypothetical protein
MVVGCGSNFSQVEIIILEENLAPWNQGNGTWTEREFMSHVELVSPSSFEFRGRYRRAKQEYRNGNFDISAQYLREGRTPSNYSIVLCKGFSRWILIVMAGA